MPGHQVRKGVLFPAPDAGEEAFGVGLVSGLHILLDRFPAERLHDIFFSAGCNLSACRRSIHTETRKTKRIFSKKETDMNHIDITPVLVLGVIFWGIVAIVREVSMNKLRHRIVDKGMDPAEAGVLFRSASAAPWWNSLKWGMVLTGIGLVLLIGQLIPADVSEEATVGAMMVAAGLALLVFHFVMSKAVAAGPDGGDAAGKPEGRKR